MVELTGSTSPIRHIPYELAYPEGFEDMRRRVPDISRIRATIGFDPQLGLDDILKSIIEHRTARVTC